MKREFYRLAKKFDVEIIEYKAYQEYQKWNYRLKIKFEEKEMDFFANYKPKSSQHPIFILFLTHLRTINYKPISIPLYEGNSLSRYNLFAT